MRKTKENKGITLVALVITIIIMLILAGVTISMLFGENGLISRAQTATNKWNEADQEGLANLENVIDNATGKTEESPKIQTPETGGIEFTRAYGVIEMVWLDTDNNVISNALSPASYLGGLTPVKWTGTAGSYTETTTDTSDTDWYSYTAQTSTTESGGTSKWANAVSSNGNAYFVWLPRYAYRITYYSDETKATIVGYSTIYGIVDVTSGTAKLVEGTEHTNVTGTVKTSAYSDYIPHPAFEFDGAKAGIWVGKYQSSGSTSTVTIKPNVTTLRNTSVSNIFTASQKVQTTYSLTSDSHMMKNTEWGAVAYLTESKYGRNGTGTTINNSSGYYTGRAGSSLSDTSYSTNGTYEYDTANGVLASTTGNIYGIYDMSGPSRVFVAGYIDNGNSYLTTYSSSLINADLKYRDVYTIASSDTQDDNYDANKGIKGDAVFETSTSGSPATSWHDSWSAFPYSSSPVFGRSRFLFQQRRSPVRSISSALRAIPLVTIPSV